MGADQGCKDSAIPEVLVEVGQLFGMELVKLVIVVLHPFEQNGLRNGIEIALGHK